LTRFIYLCIMHMLGDVSGFVRVQSHGVACLGCSSKKAEVYNNRKL